MRGRCERKRGAGKGFAHEGGGGCGAGAGNEPECVAVGGCPMDREASVSVSAYHFYTCEVCDATVDRLVASNNAHCVLAVVRLSHHILRL